MRTKKMWNVITKDGEVVCGMCKSRHEAWLCFVELIKMDKADGVFEEGFYKIVEIEYPVF